MTQLDPRLRIGELSRRVEVEPALLRAWEKRYGLLQPERSAGNFRLYSLADVRRVWAMKGHLARGLAAAEAARLALADETPARDPELPAWAGQPDAASELRKLLIELDEVAVQDFLDRAFALNPLEEVLTRIILPCLRQIGDEWERGAITVAQEHFSSTLLRARLLSLARGWGSGSGPSAILACPSGEQHDIGLICFGLVLWRQGWRIVYTGQDTPAEELRTMALAIEPEALVFASVSSQALEASLESLRSLGAGTPLAIAGPGATEQIGSKVGAVVFEGDIIAAARTLSDLRRDPR